MNGKLGAIYIGKRQVGGFLDWDVKLNLKEGDEDGNRTVKPYAWKVTARAHWLSRILDPGDEVRLKLCSDAGTGYWECTGMIDCTLTKTMETLIHTFLDVIGSGELEGKNEE